MIMTAFVIMIGFSITLYFCFSLSVNQFDRCDSHVNSINACTALVRIFNILKFYTHLSTVTYFKPFKYTNKVCLKESNFLCVCFKNNSIQL